MKLKLSLHVINCIGQVLEARSFWAFWKRTLKFIVIYILYVLQLTKFNSIQFKMVAGTVDDTLFIVQVNVFHYSAPRSPHPLPNKRSPSSWSQELNK